MTARLLKRAAVLFAVVILSSAGALACVPPHPDKSSDIPAEGVVREVIDGDTVVLKDGTEVRLTGIQAPKLPLGRPGFRTWPLAPEAKEALEELLRGKRVRLYPDARARDRYGRALAQLYADDLWIQGAMLARGLARVYTFSDNRACARALYAEEAKARAAARGIWRLSEYTIRRAEQIPDSDLGRFTLIEGRVLAVKSVGARTYLNFGDDWRTDFTVMLDLKARRLFESEGVIPETLQGVRVRVRGYVERLNGPMMVISHPEAIERLP